jgi:sulfate/thiosulfate transport system substrate-binding protein
MRRAFRAGHRLYTRAGALALVTAVGAGAALAGCGGSSDSSSSSGGGSSSGSSGGTQLALVGYSTPKKAYGALTDAFAKTSGGEGVTFSQSFGASGSQSRAVDSGQPADVVAFSTTPDMTRLVDDGIVAKSWDANPAKGMSSDSVVVMVVRKGNPKHITGWDDLIKPSTSGSARWNILAGYGAMLKDGKTPAQALDYVKTLLTKNVSVQDSSASSALNTFTSGKGDVLLDYESDAIAAQKAGDSLQYIIPKQTLLIETPIAVTSKTKHATQAKAFLDYQWSKAGQTIWAQQGYRPVMPSVAKQFTKEFPTPPQLFTIGYLGGWSKVKDQFFDPDNGSITKIEQAAGVPTAT